MKIDGDVQLSHQIWRSEYFHTVKCRRRDYSLGYGGVGTTVAVIYEKFYVFLKTSSLGLTQ